MLGAKLPAAHDKCDLPVISILLPIGNSPVTALLFIDPHGRISNLDRNPRQVRPELKTVNPLAWAQWVGFAL